MKFAHMGDCHLGGWRQPELRALNFASFQYAVQRCIKEKVDFILITGDLFDSAYPPIDILKESFAEFRKLKEAKIPVFLIAGSHDYSASGKTFLDVLEKSGFCKNVSVFEERNGSIFLQPTIHNNVALYGYPGKKSGLEVEEIKRIKLQDSPGMFKILMLHTTIRDAVGTLPIPSVDEKKLPKVDYLALSHLHITYNKEGIVYSGPIFPNNLSELEELKGGSFYFFNNGIITREEIKLKQVHTIKLEINDALKATNQIVSYLEQENLSDKVVILILSGLIEKGKTGDIDFVKIESVAKKKGALTLIKSTTKLHQQETDLVFEEVDASNLESKLLEQYNSKNPSKYNELIPSLMKSLLIDQKDEEKSSVFEERLLEEVKRVLPA